MIPQTSSDSQTNSESQPQLIADVQQALAYHAVLLDNVRDAIVGTDENFRITYWNKAAQEVYGWRSTEVMGKPTREVFQSEISEAEVDRGRSVLEEQGRYLTRAVHYHKDGQRLLVEVTIVRLAASEHANRGYVLTINDITKQEQLTAEIHRQKEMLERIVQHMPAGIAFLKGPTFVYTLVNDEYYRYASGKGELVGFTVAEKWPEIADAVIPQMEHVYRTGEPFSIVDVPLQIVHGDVTQDHYFSYTFSALYDAQGVVEGIMILAVDTTESVLVRQQIETERARLNTVLQTLPVGVWIIDETGKALMTNPQADMIWAGKAPLPENYDQYNTYRGWWAGTDEEITGNGWPIAQALINNQEYHAVGVEIDRFDGTRGSTLISAAPVRSADGKAVGAVAVMMDITELKQAQQALEQYAELLARSNQDLQNFAFVASHDLQEPLRKIITFGQILQKRLGDRQDENTQDALNRMQAAARRMQDMIQDLLNLSRVNSHGLTFTQVDLSQIVADVVYDLETLIHRTGGQVVIAAPLPLVEADALQMRQLLQNLISNALKFHKPGSAPHVRVYAETPEGSNVVIVHVEDDGIGFDLQYLNRILEPFQRLHGRSDYDGNGIGLAICKRIVERHNGEITARSVPGSGTTFSISLPLKR